MPRSASRLVASLLLELKAGRYPEHAELIDRLVAEMRGNNTGRFTSWARQMMADLIEAMRKGRPDAP